MGNKITKSLIALLTIFLVLFGCQKQQDFTTLEEKNALVKDPDASMLEKQEGEVKIVSWYPKEDVVTVKNGDTTSLSVQVGVIAGKNVAYDLVVNDKVVLQDQSDAFFQVDAATLASGANEVQVRAHNSKFEDVHSFKLYKNQAPTITSQSPEGGKGASLSCKENLAQYKIESIDLDKDSVTYTWSLDGKQDPENVIVSSSERQSSAFYKVTCADIGTHILSVQVSDGKETVETQWSFQVMNPDELEWPVEIKSFTPLEDPVVMTDLTKTTFAISINPKAGTKVTYTWSIDGVELTTGVMPFYMVNGINMTPGSHVLSVKAANSVSEKIKSFNIRKNSKPSFIAKSPNQTGNSIFCNGSSLTFSGTVDDLDNDPMQFSWFVNGAAAPSMVNATTTSKSSTAVFTPTCALIGTNVITLRVSDGLEFSSYDWSLTVQQNLADTLGPVEIKSFIPLDNPVIMTNSTKQTFAISVHPKAGANVIYTFSLDNSEVSNGSTPFVNVNGTDLTAGTHTLTATATNLVSSASKTFNIRKNSKPVIANTVPNQSGNTVYCDGSTLTLSASASDADSDGMTFSWLLNGGVGSSSLSVSSTASTSSVIFTPTCGMIGGNIITLQVSDGIEIQSYDWSVNVQQNPNDLEQPITIQAFTPTSDPVVMTNQSLITFATSVNPSAGIHVNYLFRVDATDMQTGSTPFYVLNGNTLTAGNHILMVTASNTLSTINKTFNIRKNSLPTIPTKSPSQTGNTVYCGGSTMNFSVAANDVDNDSLSFTWLVNGAAAPSMFSQTNTTTTSAAIFTPTCSLEGTNVVSVRVNDGFETVTYDWSVSVQNPIVVAIAAYTPTASPIVINSTASQVFTVTATGKPPLAYEWILDGTSISGETLATINISGAGISAGNHTLDVKVSDFNSNATHSFSIVRNAVPVLSSPVPSNASTIKMNVDSVYTFNISGADANSDAISYTWKLDSSVSARLSSSSTAGGSQGVFAPTTSQLGNHVISVTASDGRESSEYTWNVNVNYFSEECNNLAAGKICTLVGDAKVGDSSDPLTESANIKMLPFATSDDGSGNTFIADAQNLIWFYNRSASSLVRLGTTIPAGKIKVVAGVGAPGTGTSGQSALDFPFYNPRGLAYDASRDYLYVSDYSNQRIERINHSGVVEVIAGTGGTTNNASTNTEGAVATTHVCYSPVGITYNVSLDELVVACYSSTAIKRFTSVSNATLSNIKGYTLVGALDGTGATTAATVDGLTGTTTGYAQVRNPWGLTMDPNNGNIFFTEYYPGCTVRVINRTGSAINYINGAVSAPAGQVKTLAGISGTCSSTTGALASVRYYYPVSISLLFNGAGTTLRGFFTGGLDDRIRYLSNEATAATFGGQAINAGEDQFVAGTGTGGFNNDGFTGNITAINDPYGLYVSNDKSKIYFADYSNRRFRTFDISVTSGQVHTEIGIGNTMTSPYTGDTALGAQDVKFNNPTYLKYNNGMLYVSDQGNGRIRQVDMVTGEVSRFAGNGIGYTSADVPTNIYTRGVYGLEVVGSTLLFVDDEYASGANRTCQVRGFNFGSSASNVFGTNILSNFVDTVAGLYSSGCIAWSDATQNNKPATTVGFYYPEDVASNGTTLYISNYQSHCIMAVNTSGTLSRTIGDCVNAGATDNVSIAGGTARLRYPIGMAIDPTYYAAGNLFIADQTDQANALIRYANFSGNAVTIAGVSIPAGYIRTVFSLPSTPRPAGIAVFANQICIAEGQTTAQTGLQNVICKDRNAAFDTTTLRVGSAPVTVPGKPPIYGGQEGITASTSTLCGPWGIEFDDAGNLYIPERCSHIIRMVKKWW